jgi:hypothetical protein
MAAFACYFQHLLCIILQAVACIALDPGNHGALTDADMPDTLMQLLLPSDEWYYTNHSTKYARYVKFHAARVLVYMGLFQRLGGRIDLFDLKRTYQCTSAHCEILSSFVTLTLSCCCCEMFHTHLQRNVTLQLTGNSAGPLTGAGIFAFGTWCRLPVESRPPN